MNCVHCALALSAALTFIVPHATGQASQPDQTSIYARDVEFLLTELEKRASHFLATKQIDWPAVAAQFRREVTSVTTDAEHARLCERLLARLRDGHAGLTDVKPALPDESHGRRFTGPRIHLIKIEDRFYIRQAFAPPKPASRPAWK